METNKLINLVKHAKTFHGEFFFAIRKPSNILEIEIASYVEPEELNESVDNLKNKALFNFLKHLERNNIEYAIRKDKDFNLAIVQFSIELQKEQCTPIQEVAVTLEDFLEGIELETKLEAAEAKNDEDDYDDYDPDQDDDR